MTTQPPPQPDKSRKSGDESTIISRPLEPDVLDAIEQRIEDGCESVDDLLLYLSETLVRLKTAAMNGDAVAQFQLGELYSCGEGVPQDIAQAAIWFRKAADQGKVEAQYFLGVLYADDNPLQNYAEGAMWSRRAADHGFAPAQYSLGLLYEFGNGVAQDYEQAAEWYRKAADQGQSDAELKLGFFYEHGHGVPQDLNEAFYCYLRSANQGNADAQNNLGNCYFHGIGAKKDHEQAAIWFRKAAEQGLDIAKWNLLSLRGERAKDRSDSLQPASGRAATNSNAEEPPRTAAVTITNSMATTEATRLDDTHAPSPVVLPNGVSNAHTLGTPTARGDSSLLAKLVMSLVGGLAAAVSLCYVLYGIEDMRVVVVMMILFTPALFGLGKEENAEKTIRMIFLIIGLLVLWRAFDGLPDNDAERWPAVE